MGRKSDYVAQFEREEAKKLGENASLEIAKRKLGRETLSISEMAELVSDVESHCLPEGSGPINLHVDTIKERLRRICEKSNGLLKIDYFKAGTKGVYQFEPEYSRLMLTLLSSGYIEGRTERTKPLTWRIELYARLFKIIDDVLREEDQNFIKDHPAYNNAELEMRLGSLIISELSSTMNSLYQINSVVRFRFMFQFLLSLLELNQNYLSVVKKLGDEKLYIDYDLPESYRTTDLKEQLRWADTLERLIEVLIEYRRQGKKPVYIEEAEELSYPVFTYAKKIFGLSSNKSEYQNIWRTIENELEKQQRYQEIMRGIEEIIDRNRPGEALLLVEIEDLVKMMYLHSDVSLEDFNRIMRFTEDNLQEEKTRMLEVVRKLSMIEHSLMIMNKFKQDQEKQEDAKTQ